MMKLGLPNWQKISCNTNKADCVAVYELEKKKLKNLLKNVNKKSVLSFVHIPPPRRGVETSDAIFKCIKEWGIENKIFTISVDNASNNDVAIRLLKDTFSMSKNLVCAGKLFHVRCCAHILNLMVQDGLSQIVDITNNIRKSVEFVNRSDGRLLLFADIVQQLRLPGRKLIYDCRTRWNSTFEMLSCAIKFKEVFPRFRDREPHYDCCPLEEDWVKVVKVCNILETFWATTQIISCSDYPISNLFLQEIKRVKLVLDSGVNDEDDFIRAMVRKMKTKFDKYCGECNLLMAVAAILDPRQKLKAVEFCLSQLFPPNEVQENISKVRIVIFELYDEYVAANDHDQLGKRKMSQVGDSSMDALISSSTSGWNDFDDFLRQSETFEPQKSELVDYLEKGV
ncbi:hypothetical protein ACH5RR_012153 [Cinchona calisaya]|uniref:hAT-like transposase RNase-H fold domain-containing protein n=1 Tax=Cinchona calisaya TaxID=153742 RepID=A0ABD3A9I5_9GENT